MSEFISAQGYARLEAELNELYTKERPKVVNQVAAAAAEGDRSENAEYIYGKKRLREIDKRLEFLTKRLDKLEIRRPPVSTHEVAFLSWVEVENDKGEVRVFRLVGADETEAKDGLISYRSPVGEALMKRTVDDTVRVNTPGGVVEYTVLRISQKRPEPAE